MKIIINLTTMTKLEEYKAHAYDCLANIERLQKELQATNQLIANYKEEQVKVEKVKVEKVVRIDK